ncbi:TDT family transporter [Hungatella sp. L12]|uniref:TDT family transporter n=1 Tax=Hungatella hominis TaxID=2763050 RepID=A0ABR7GZP7_9FIRM|nr:TDT family transporter [Hungatella hominis]MBC5706404.1 TDT family transporter [Hungatella hominis]
MKERLKNMPIPVVATMLGAATLSNIYQGLGYDWIRHVTMWASTVVLLFYIAKIVLYPSIVKGEYKNTVPASLYAGITMVTMILCSYYKDWFPGAARVVLIAAVCIHAVHIAVFLFNNVFHGVKLDTFVPSWFVTFNGIMVSTVVGAAMLPPVMAKAVLIWGLCIYTVTIPFMIWRLAAKEVKPAVRHTQAIVLAPCSLCLASYLNLAAEPSMILVSVLFLCVFLSLAFIIVKLPSFFAVPFAPGFAGLTFPMAIGIVASNKAAAFFTGAGQETLGYVVKQIAGVQIYLTTAIIGMVLFGFMKLLCSPAKKQA